MRNVVAYCRVSTDKTDQLNSFQAQKDFFTEYSKINNLNLVHIYADEGISGTKTKNRTAFNQMMKDSESHIFELVLVKDISRLARNTVDLLQSVRKLRSLNIDTQFITANMTTLGESEFMLTIFGALAQEESANISKRIKFGKKITAERGRVPNLCYGYKKIIKDNYHLDINEQEAEVVRNIFDLYVNQGYGQMRISKILNEQGIKSARGGEWTQASVKRILQNKIYAGYIINNKSEISNFLTGERTKKESNEWIEVQNPELAIINLELWEKAQKISKSQTIQFKTDNTHRNNKFLFSTIIQCEDCQHSFRRMYKEYPNRTRVWWVCSTRNTKGVDYCCNKTTIDENDLIDKIDKYLYQLMENKYNFMKECEKQFNVINSQNNPNTIDINEFETLQLRLKKLQKLKIKQVEMFEDDIINREELKLNVAKINSEIGEIEFKVNQIETNNKSHNNDITKYLEGVESTINNIDNFLTKYCTIEKMTNSQLQTFIDKIMVNHNGDIKIYLKNIN